ncbi:hypothetical protein [Streptomyces rochei]|uniref:hypothetical protein n=1 Tax=Streptomyces rochei TaxID=1928 RepID=UPI003629163E
MEPGTGRHRAAPATRVEVPLTGLQDTGTWPQPVRAYGAVAPQCWDDCPHCGHATAGVLHADGRTCGECLTTAPAAASEEAL